VPPASVCRAWHESVPRGYSDRRPAGCAAPIHYLGCPRPRALSKRLRSALMAHVPAVAASNALQRLSFPTGDHQSLCLALLSLRCGPAGRVDLMLARGVEASHEAIRLWTLRFGTEYARRLRRTRGACSNIWHLDELCLMINGERGWLWRAVDD